MGYFFWGHGPQLTDVVPSVCRLHVLNLKVKPIDERYPVIWGHLNATSSQHSNAPLPYQLVRACNINKGNKNNKNSLDVEKRLGAAMVCTRRARPTWNWTRHGLLVRAGAKEYLPERRWGRCSQWGRGGYSCSAWAGFEYCHMILFTIASCSKSLQWKRPTCFRKVSLAFGVKIKRRH